MEKLDKNYVIGLILLFVMYGTYMYLYPTPINEPTPVEEAQVETKPAQTENLPLDTVNVAAKLGSLAALASGTENMVVIENENLQVFLSNKGGGIKKVVLKKYKSYQDFVEEKEVPMVLFNGLKKSLSLEVPLNGRVVDLNDLYFDVSKSSSSQVTFSLNAEGQTITQSYNLNPDNYIVEYTATMPNLSAPINLTWNNDLLEIEKDMAENRKATQINFYDLEEEFDDIGLNSVSNDAELAENPLLWFSFKQKYFTSGVAANTGSFENVSAELLIPNNDEIVKEGKVKAKVKPEVLQNGLKFYFGPNDMQELKKMGGDFHQNLYLGYDIVKPINRYIFVPLFDWVEGFVSNYGLLIILVVLMIKIALTPLIYKSYKSSAKMRVLSPEVAKIKEAAGEDQMKVQQETMKLYQQVGVSPLSGCVPMLLQMPILMSVFFLFPNMEMFRQKGFLWANDLSTYDDLIRFGFDVPIIGNHISLFVVLMTISSLAFTYYNNQATPDQPGPIDMKKISYIFPLVFFFVLNSFPAALSFYYLVSNLVTIGQQLIVKRFIDEDKIKSILEENKRNYSARPKKNKFADYLQKQLEAQENANKKKAEELKSKKNRK